MLHWFNISLFDIAFFIVTLFNVVLFKYFMWKTKILPELNLLDQVILNISSNYFFIFCQNLQNWQELILLKYIGFFIFQ